MPTGDNATLWTNGRSCSTPLSIRHKIVATCKTPQKRTKRACIVRAVPPMTTADFRLPAELKARVQAEAEAEGLAFSEFVRQALAVRLAWIDALRVLQLGDDDPRVSAERLAQCLAEVAEMERLKAPPKRGNRRG